MPLSRIASLVRATSPETTGLGPISMVPVTPLSARYCMPSTQRSGEVRCLSYAALISAGSDRADAVTLLTTGAQGRANGTLSRALFSCSAAWLM